MSKEKNGRKMTAFQVEALGFGLMTHCRENGILPDEVTNEEINEVLDDDGLYLTLWEGFKWHLQNRRNQLADLKKKQANKK